MESDSWSRLFAPAKRHLPRFGDVFLGFEEVEGREEEDSKADYPCPFCSDDFDVVGLCFHIEDEHPVEAKNGICPVCMDRVGVDLVGHLTTEHKSFFKMQQKKRKSRKGSSLSRKDNNYQSFFNGSGFVNVLSNNAPDPLLSSFVTNLSTFDLSNDVKSEPPNDEAVSESSEENTIERVEASVPVEEQVERSRKSQFARGLVLSTIFDEDDFL